MQRVHNFSAGPAALPQEVLSATANELLDYQGSGMSVLEMSHRSKTFMDIAHAAEESLRRLLNIPNTYRVLFLQGGATLSFAAVALNLMRTRHAGYVVSGHFSERARLEAERYGTAEIVASSADTQFDRIPDVALQEQACAQGNLDYLHICQNNTIYGTMFSQLPQTGSTPLVADVSSCFLALPLDITRYGMLYAGAQKNAGPAGVCIVIVREDLIEEGPACADICPTYLDLRLQAQKESMYNTPNTFGIYLCGKVFSWIEQLGGIDAIYEKNLAKARLLYDFLDASELFTLAAQPQSRSLCNVVFRTQSPDLDAACISGAQELGIVGIKGHRLVGGMRASIYNAVSLESVQALVRYLSAFERKHSNKS